jgi:hypothetical protein
MNDKEIFSHKAIASSMNKCELMSIIKELKKEEDELKPYLTNEEIDKYRVALSIYCGELEYVMRVNTYNDSSLTH